MIRARPGSLTPTTLPSRNNTPLWYCVTTFTESDNPIRATMARNTRKAIRAFMTCPYWKMRGRSWQKSSGEPGRPGCLCGRIELVRATALLVSLAAGGRCLAAIDRGLPLQAQSPGRFDVDLNLEGVGHYGEHVGERFLIPSVVRVLLGLIADRLAVDVALSGARLGHD